MNCSTKWMPTGVLPTTCQPVSYTFLIIRFWKSHWPWIRSRKKSSDTGEPYLDKTSSMYTATVSSNVMIWIWFFFPVRDMAEISWSPTLIWKVLIVKFIRTSARMRKAWRKCSSSSHSHAEFRVTVLQKHQVLSMRVENLDIQLLTALVLFWTTRILSLQLLSVTVKLKQDRLLLHGSPTNSWTRSQTVLFFQSFIWTDTRSVTRPFSHVFLMRKWKTSSRAADGNLTS